MSLAVFIIEIANIISVIQFVERYCISVVSLVIFLYIKFLNICHVGGADLKEAFEQVSCIAAMFKITNNYL